MREVYTAWIWLYEFKILIYTLQAFIKPNDDESNMSRINQIDVVNGNVFRT